jgi:hypothetical protein
MAESTTNSTVIAGPIDCACVIYGDAYSWTYVERLYNMLSRHITPGIRMHVYTESSRIVPDHMIKHVLQDFGKLGPRRAWWYKMQLFNTDYHSGPMLYFDLDTVIVNNIDWIWNLPLTYFWTVCDFKQLWRPTHYGINSSVMWWDTRQFYKIWQQFQLRPLAEIMRSYPGDQDYLTAGIPDTERRFFDQSYVQSWRWQCKDGGYDFHNRCHLKPDSGTSFLDQTSVLVFHGRPKPDQITDPVIQQHWR